MLAPLACSAKGTNKIKIIFESDDECFKDELVEETFEFEVVEGLYPCFSKLPVVNALYDSPTEQVLDLPPLKYPIKFEDAVVKKMPSWLKFDQDKWQLIVAAGTK